MQKALNRSHKSDLQPVYEYRPSRSPKTRCRTRDKCNISHPVCPSSAHLHQDRKGAPWVERLENQGIELSRGGLFVELRAGLSGIVAVGLVVAIAAPLVVAADVDGKKPSRQAVAQGRAIFEREWQPGDSRTHGGDGLGPVFNDSSCVACHNLGGTGGAGSSGKNVDIITATPNMSLPEVMPPEQPENTSFLARRFDR